MVWRMVLRKTAEITSAAPARARNSSASHNEVTAPKSVMVAPQAATATMTAIPCRRTDATQPVVSAPTSAPAPGAADSRP